MIEPFESAFADLLADRLSGNPGIGSVVRPRDGLPALQGSSARVSVQVVDAEVTGAIGEAKDEELRQAGDILIRSSLRMSGRLQVAVEVADSGGAAQLGQRAALLNACDAVLVALHDPAVRSGSVWGDDHDQGFAIDGFRIDRLVPAAGASGVIRRYEIFGTYNGRFWPVEPLVEGSLIRPPVRVAMATMDAVLPAGLTATGGAQDVTAPVSVNLTTLGGAPVRLVARLAGAAPPGQLIGSAAGVPAGSVGYTPTADGRFDVVFRPAAVLAGSAVARVVLSLAGEDRSTVRIGEFEITVEA